MVWRRSGYIARVGILQSSDACSPKRKPLAYVPSGHDFVAHGAYRFECVRCCSPLRLARSLSLRHSAPGALHRRRTRAAHATDASHATDAQATDAAQNRNSERLFLRELMAAEEKPEIILPLGRLSGHLSSGF